MFLTGIRRKDGAARGGRFPWTQPLVAGLQSLEFAAEVTFLVGEDGCGKSALLEGLAAGMGAEVAALEQIEDDLRRELPEGSSGQARATGAVAGHRRALAARYGEDPGARSHGETFLELLSARLVPRGLYFLDEPETPLSPIRVLVLMALLRDRVAEGCQFVIATHSPILMALPGAAIWLLEGDRIRLAAYEEVEHVRITRAFLNGPGNYLRRL